MFGHVARADWGSVLRMADELKVGGEMPAWEIEENLEEAYLGGYGQFEIGDWDGS